MNHGSDDVLIACGWTRAERPGVRRRCLPNLAPRCSEGKRSGMGMLSHLACDGKWISIIAKIIAAERECCRFLTFQFVAQPSRGTDHRPRDWPPGTKDC